MNNNINIAEILKDYPKGTKLYSLVDGKVTLESICNVGQYRIRVNTDNGNTNYFTKDGKIYADRPNGECVLFPSKEMRDWTKLFKKGDIVRSKEDGMYAIFKGWRNDDYTEFNITINYYTSFNLFSTENVCHTNDFVKANDEEEAVFIANIEKYYNGKYNPNTLQVEPIKSKCEFKPFEKVLVRDEPNQEWSISLFSYYDEEDKNYPYVCLNARYSCCIPYKSNEHFVGKKVNIH
nr:MAG TPA: hypothetical protein [Caudoviricetes sp.]